MAKKRKNFRLPNKAGSVYKLPGNRRNPWTAVMHCGYENDGRAVRKYIGYYPTQEEAIHALEMYKETPFDLGNKNVTVERLFAVLMERKKEKSPLTLNNYRAAFRHLSPLHQKPIRALRTHDWQAVFDGIAVSPASKQPIKTVATMLYKLAAEMDIINKNYASFVRIGPAEKSTIHKPFSALEIRRLWAAAETDTFAEIPLLLCYTGMRPQELLNVKIADINLSEGYITGGLKTQAGRNRCIPIHADIRGILERRMAENENYLIQAPRGGQIYYSKMLKRWKSLMLSLNFDHSPHDGRHTFVSTAQKKGMDGLTLKRIIGHASKDLTADVYTHFDVADLVKAVNIL